MNLMQKQVTIQLKMHCQTGKNPLAPVIKFWYAITFFDIF